LQTLKQVRESWSKRIAKPVKQYSKTTFYRHAKNFVTIIENNFIQSTKSNFHNQDLVKLKSVKYVVNNQNYFSILKRTLHKKELNINYHLPREYIITNERNDLTQRMTKDIPIKLVNINTMITDKEFDNIVEEPDNESNNLDSK
ncbi:22478_t:CDS:2, partial [Racocetra persica]